MMPTLSSNALLPFLSVLFILSPACAFADALTCSGGVPTSDNATMFQTDVCSSQTGIQHLFSWILCDFEQILNQVMDALYCGIQDYFARNVLPPLLTVYVAIFGVQLWMGHTELRGGDIAVRMFKIALVITFCTASYGYGAGFIFSFFIAFIQDTVSWVLTASALTDNTMTNGDTTTFYDAMDDLIYRAVLGPFTKTNSSVLGFFAVMAAAFPMVFTMAAYWLWMNFLIIMRTLLGYVMGISAIAFLITLSPIFISCMLFQYTYHFFDNWTKYLFSYAINITVTLTAVATWLDVLSFFPAFFNQLSNLVIHDPKIISKATINQAKDTWGICKGYTYTDQMYYADGNFSTTPPDSVPGYWSGPWITPSNDSASCDPNNITFASELLKDTNFIYFIIFNLACLCLINYAYNALLKNIPSIAQQLSGPAFVPKLGAQLGSQAFGNFSSGFGSATSGIQSNMPAGSAGNSATSSLGSALSSLVGNRSAPK